MQEFCPFHDLPADFFQRNAHTILSFGWEFRQGTNIRPMSWKSTKATVMALYKELIAMAKQADKDKKKYVKPKSVEWVNYQLSADDNENLDSWEIAPVEILTGVLAFYQDRLELVLKPSEDGSTFLAFLFNNAVGSDDYGLAISAKSTDALDCLKVLLFKHHSVFMGNWASHKSNSASRPKRG